MAVVALNAACSWRLPPTLRSRFSGTRVVLLKPLFSSIEWFTDETACLSSKEAKEQCHTVIRSTKRRLNPESPQKQPSESSTPGKDTESETTETPALTTKYNTVGKKKLGKSGKEIGWSFLASKKERNAYQKALDELTDDEAPSVDLTNPSRDTEGPLPTVTRDQVINSCLSVSFGIFVMSFLLRNYTANAPDSLGNDPLTVQSLLSLTPSFSWDHIAIAVTATIVVSGARVLLYNNWKDFAVAANRSNKQVLTPLSFGDLLVVSFVPGISEELLFRGALIPALFADWRGVLISGIVFGALHNSGGRNIAFAAWASAVGCLYGFAFLLTQDVYVPIFAHSSANLFSAMYWLSLNTNKSEKD